ncbi:MAG TPA: hypothetical protein VI298_07085 [Geobacteraceae bacterium]
MRVALVVSILLLLCRIGLCAESQPPTPSSLKSGAQQVKDREHPKNATNELKQAPTAQRVVPIPSTNPESQIPMQNKNDKSPSEWWLIGLTAVLALATYRLVVQTRRLVTETAIASKRQAAETQDALNISRQAADAAQKSSEVAEKALTLLERPYVFVFGVRQFHLNPDNLELSVDYEVANFGKTPAIIERAHIVIENIESNLNAPLEVERRHSLVIAPILGAGEIRKNLAEDAPTNMLKYTTINSGFIPDLHHGDNVFFRALIYYRGSFTKGHVSSFCWRYNTHTAHFEPYGHDDYNYTN